MKKKITIIVEDTTNEGIIIGMEETLYFIKEGHHYGYNCGWQKDGEQFGYEFIIEDTLDIDAIFDSYGKIINKQHLGMED